MPSREDEQQAIEFAVASGRCHRVTPQEIEEYEIRAAAERGARATRNNLSGRSVEGQRRRRIERRLRAEGIFA